MGSCISGKAEAEKGMEESRWDDNHDKSYEEECDRSCPQQDVPSSSSLG